LTSSIVTYFLQSIWLTESAVELAYGLDMMNKVLQ